LFAGVVREERLGTRRPRFHLRELRVEQPAQLRGSPAKQLRVVLIALGFGVEAEPRVGLRQGDQLLGDRHFLQHDLAHGVEEDHPLGGFLLLCQFLPQ